MLVLKIVKLLNVTINPNQNTPGIKKVVAKNLKQTMLLKTMRNQNGRPRPPAANGIKIFDNDDQAATHYCFLPTVKL